MLEELEIGETKEGRGLLVFIIHLAEVVDLIMYIAIQIKHQVFKGTIFLYHLPRESRFRE